MWAPCYLEIWAATWGRPYNSDDPMEMIGHNNTFVTFHIGKLAWQLVPPSCDHTPCIVKLHFPIRTVSK